MTKKDYVAIAKVLNGQHLLISQLTADEQCDREMMLKEIIEGLAAYFSADNPNFNAGKFKEAIFKK